MSNITTQKNAIHAVPSACSKTPPVGRGLDRSKIPAKRINNYQSSNTEIYAKILYCLTDVVKSKKTSRKDVSSHWIFTVHPPREGYSGNKTIWLHSQAHSRNFNTGMKNWEWGLEVRLSAIILLLQPFLHFILLTS